MPQYPKGLQDLVDRLWTSSANKDKPLLHITPVSADIVQLSPLELSTTDTLDEGQTDGDGLPRKVTVSFADMEDDSRVSLAENEAAGRSH